MAGHLEGIASAVDIGATTSKLEGLGRDERFETLDDVEALGLTRKRLEDLMASRPTPDIGRD